MLLAAQMYGISFSALFWGLLFDGLALRYNGEG